MTGKPAFSRSSSFVSIDTNASQSNAALLGAATAFGNAAAPTLRKKHSGTDALAAATTSAGAASKEPSPHRGRARSPLSIAGSPAKSPGGYGPKEKISSSSMRSNASSLAVPQEGRPRNTRSQSQQAAMLAASRAPPLSTTSAISAQGRTSYTRAKTFEKPKIAPKPRRLSQQFNLTKTKDETATDATPISSTSSLVGLFEQKLKVVSSPKNERPAPVVIRPSQELTLTTPKPLKPTEGITSVFHMELDGVRDKDKAYARSIHDEEDTSHAPGELSGSSYDDSAIHGYSSRHQPQQSSPINIPQHGHYAITKGTTVGSGPRQTEFIPSPLRSSTSMSNATSLKPPSRSSTAQPESVSSSVQSLKTISGQYNYLHPRRMGPMMTGDELANAMVASSLASSRAHSPTRLEPPPVQPRKKKGHHSIIHFSRTPSPAKTGMLHTLRNHNSSDESDEGNHPYGKHRKRRLVRKHPNKHHEGDRKRWRDAVTERERRRYEGVWAANKGLHCQLTAEEEASLHSRSARRGGGSGDLDSRRTSDVAAAMVDQVSNVVVRDVWNRSRLPEAVLEMVWDLVDNDCVGRLQKEEFVVGLWLIDQRLKGRKLPVKVSDSVWASVRGLQGIKIRKK